MTPFEMSRTVFWLNPFPESLRIAQFIRERTEPEDRIAVLGSEPQIFFYAQRHSASGYIYMYPMMEDHDFAQKMQDEFLAEIEAAEPKYLVYVYVPTSWLQRPDSSRDIARWFQERWERGDYNPVGVVELYEDRSTFRWAPDLQWPPSSQFWVVVLERAG